MQADNESVRVHHGVLGLYSGVLYMGGGGYNLARASSDIRERSDLYLQEAYICLSCNAYAVTAYAWNSRPRGNSRKGNNPNQPVNQTT